MIDNYLEELQERNNKLTDINRVNHINELNELKIPRNKVLLAGSAVLTLYGLRNNKDLDVTIPKNIFDKFRKDKRLKYSTTPTGNEILSYKNVDLHHDNWPFKNSVEDELKRSLVVDGYHFYTLERLIEWKKIVNRQKDKDDIKVIKDFMKKNNI